MSSLTRKGFAGLALAATIAVGCGGGDDAATSAADRRTIAALDADGVPGELNGLSVVRENISDTIEAARRPYLDAAVFFSIREEQTLQATLQIGRFANDVDAADEDFQATLLAAIGGAGVKELRMGENRVWLSTGDRQQIAVWFTADDVYILSTRDDYEFPRSLLRAALEVRP